MTRIIGLTGGIGSGKTTIAQFFLEAKIPVYIADNEAKKLMTTKEILSEIKKVFGNIVFENAVLSREKLSQIVFSNPEKLAVLNSIIHPAVKEHFTKWVQEHKKKSLVVYESAILFESGSYENWDSIITVLAPLETRIQRVMQRDKIARDQVLNRVKAQWTDEQKIAKSDFVIENITIEKTKIEFNKILKILNIS